MIFPRLSTKSIKKAILQNRLFSAAIVIQVCLVIVRTANIWVTGYVSSDEANYALRSIVAIPYGDRYFFDFVNIALFRLFGITSLNAFLVFFPFYVTFWSVGVLIAAYKVVGLVCDKREVRGYVIITLPFMITYSLLSVGFLTETPALLMCLIGIYAILSYMKRERKWFLPPLAILAFVGATYTREPYLLFPFAGAILLAAFILSRNVKLTHIGHLLIAIVPISLLFLTPYTPLTPFLQPGGAPLVLPGPPPPTPVTTTSTTTVVTNSTLVANSTTFVTSVTVTNTVTTTMSTTTSTTTAVVPPPPTPPGVLSVIVPTLYLFFVGVILGWNPILFIVGILGVALLLYTALWKRKDFSLVLLALTGLACFAIVSLQYSASAQFYTSTGLSTLVRYANPTVTAYVLIAPFAYEKFGANKMKILALTLVGFTVVGFGAYSTITQTNLSLPFNAFEFGHQYEPLTARNYLLANVPSSSHMLIYISWDWKVGQLYLLGIPGLTVYPTFLQPYVNDSALVALRPSSFYVMGAAPLSDNANASVATLGLTNPPPFLMEALEAAFKQPIQTGAPGYQVTSATVIYNEATGYLMKVNVAWTNSTAS